MRVDGSNSDKNAEVIARIQEYARGRAPQKAANTSAAGPTPEASNVQPATGEEEGRARGALRLLEEGHFKGVPALRLSINFAEEIQAANGVKTQEAIGSALPGLQEELNGAIEAFIAETELTPEELETLESARDSFNTAVAGLLGGEEGVEAAGSSDIFGELRTAFQDFLNSLIPPQEEPEGEAIIPVEESVEETPESTETIAPSAVITESETEPSETNDVFAGLRDTLSGIFESTISGLEETVAAINQPVIPEPEGNGRAYEKFLAAYNELYGTGSTGETAPEEEGLNTIT